MTYTQPEGVNRNLNPTTKAPAMPRNVGTQDLLAVRVDVFLTAEDCARILATYHQSDRNLVGRRTALDAIRDWVKANGTQGIPTLHTMHRPELWAIHLDWGHKQVQRLWPGWLEG